MMHADMALPASFWEKLFAPDDHTTQECLQLTLFPAVSPREGPAADQSRQRRLFLRRRLRLGDMARSGVFWCLESSDTLDRCAYRIGLDQ